MKLKLLTPLIAGSMLLASNSAFAVTADDVVCAGCVNSVDIANNAISAGKILNGSIPGIKLKNGSIGSAKLFNGAVRTEKIVDGAVTGAKIADGAITGANIATGTIGSGKLINGTVRTPKIADGAVTENKLSAAVQSKLNAAGGGLPTYNRIIGTATQKVFNLFGDFTQSGGPSICQSAGSDTEVRDITRTPVTGGTLIEIIRTRFNGGTVGTKCHHHVLTFFDNGTESTLVKRERWNTAGTTLNQTDAFLDFDAVDCNDCGIITREDDMSQGLVLASGGFLTSTNGSSVVINEELVISLISLQEVNSEETINEGEIDEQVFTGCQSYVEDRASTNIGSFKTYRVGCPTVGGIAQYRRRTDGKSQMWELSSYTAP